MVDPKSNIVEIVDNHPAYHQRKLSLVDIGPPPRTSNLTKKPSAESGMEDSHIQMTEAIIKPKYHT